LRLWEVIATKFLYPAAERVCGCLFTSWFRRKARFFIAHRAHLAKHLYP